MYNIKIFLLLIILVLLLPFCLASETLYSENGNVHLNIIIPPHPKIIKQTGFEKNFLYSINVIDDHNIKITTCHKNFAKNKNLKINNKDDLDKYPVKKNQKEIKKLKLKSKECDSVILNLKKNEILKFGEDSTEIIIDGDNITLSVIPEENKCSYLFCESEIIFKNEGNSTIIFNTKDINVKLESKSHYILTELEKLVEITQCKDSDCNLTNITQYMLNDDEQDIAIEPENQKIFYLKATLNSVNDVFKYNVTFSYNNVTYIIDPYFYTTNTTFNNGEYNQTYQNESGFVQLNLSYTNGHYYSEIFNFSSVNEYKNITWYELPNNQTKLYGLNISENVLLYHLNNNSNFGENETHVYDFSNTGNNGTVLGATYTTMSKLGAGAYDFDGVDDLINVSNHPSIYFNTTGNYTWSAWVKPNSTVDFVDNGVFFSKGLNGTSGYVFGHAGDDLCVGVYSSGLGGVTLQCANNVMTTNWQHVVLTYSNGTKRLFHNGFNVINLSAPPSILAATSDFTNDLYIGRSDIMISPLNPQPIYHNGSMDELIIWNRILNDNEILNNYKRTVLKFNLSVRSCNDQNCVGEVWQQEFDLPNQTLSLVNNPYFQYMAEFITTDQNVTPELWGVTVGYEINCTPDWIEYNECLINDTELKYYLDNNSCGSNLSLPSDNGTYTPCNYCSENITTTILKNCSYVDGEFIINYTYTDNNYYSCCAITTLSNDCSILYSPYNETYYTQLCNIFNNTMDCNTNTFSEYGFFDDKINWLCNIETNKTTTCLSYIMDTENGIVQVNPENKTKTDTFFSLNPNTETRTVFNVENGLVQVYFTKNNLLFDGREYVYGVKCSDGSNVYNYMELVNPEYENVKKPITRYFWFKDNITPTILALIVLIIIIITISIFISMIRQGWKGR